MEKKWEFLLGYFGMGWGTFRHCQVEKIRLAEELTDIIREYIEKRYGIIAMELTSVEIIESFSGLGIASPSSDILLQVLGLADMVKFAKAKPLANEHTLSMKNAYEFVLAGVTVVEKEDTEEQALDTDMKTI